MNEDLDSKLRHALRPVDPGAQFTRRVMKRATAAPRRARTFRMGWIPAALAASLALIAVGLYQQRVHKQQQAGLAARAQVLAALHVTSEKLDLAYRLVNKGT